MDFSFNVCVVIQHGSSDVDVQKITCNLGLSWWSWQVHWICGGKSKKEKGTGKRRQDHMSMSWLLQFEKVS